MMVFLASLMATGVSVWASMAVADLIEKPSNGTNARHVVVLSDDDETAPKVAEFEDSEAKEGKNCVVMVQVGDGKDDAGSAHATVHWVGNGGDAAEDTAWLGVSIGGVSDSVATDRKLAGKGVMILNVVKGSPADQAGLLENDVILSIGGEPAEGGLGQLVDLVTAHEPGETVEVVVLRDGEEKSIPVELGSRAQTKTFEWKFDMGPFGEMREKIRAHARVLRTDDDGKLSLEDLGDLSDWSVLKELPDSIRAFIPESDDRTVQVWVDNDKKTLKKVVERKDGSSLAIEQEDGGEIVVRRTDGNGEETETRYADEDALQAGDEEAYDAFAHTGHASFIQCDIDLDGDPGFPQINFAFNTDEWKKAASAWRNEVEEQLSAARQAREEAMHGLHEAIEQWKGGGVPGLPRAIQELPAILQRLDVDEALHPFARARYSFHVDEDGKIEARLRKGDSEIVRSFASEEDLARRDETLYRKYQDLMSEDAE